jgi:dephospho-CoA kinase
MKAFGLTGGVGMGKSAAADILHQRGIPVVDTDLLARQTVEPGQPALEEIHREFGDGVIGPDGRLLRRELGRIVFSNPDARNKLEAITHPRIRALWKTRIEQWRTQGHSLAVVVIPLLFETRAESDLDATVCVACSASTQRERLALRGWDILEMERRIAAQWPVNRKMDQANHVAWSEGPIEVLAGQLACIFH